MPSRLLPLSIIALAGLTTYLCDTVFADAIDSYTFVSFESFHSPWVPALAILGYILMVVFLPMLLRGAKPVNMSGVMFVHNYFLSYLSIVMFLGFLRVDVEQYQREGLYELFCDLKQQQEKTRLYFWLLIFYLSKMYEFIDTLILILRQVSLSSRFHSLFFGRVWA